MLLSQSAVLWQNRGGIEKIALFGKIPNPYHVKNSKEISKDMKLSQPFKFQDLWKFLQVQLQKPSSAMMKLALMRTATGMEDPELPLLQRISSLKLTAPQIAAHINASQSSSNRHISTSTVQRRLCESDLHGQFAAKKPPLKDTNKKKKLAWAKKHEQWTLDRWKSVLWFDE